MAEKKKIKDTGLGKWLSKAAPNVLDTVGDLLPDSGALGMVKNLLDKEPGISAEEAKARVDAEIAYQNNVTERWKADMSSDVKLAKYIRPVTLIALMGMFVVTMVLDSMDNLPFNVKDSYVSLLKYLSLPHLVLFAGRTIEKSKARCLKKILTSADPKPSTKIEKSPATSKAQRTASPVVANKNPRSEEQGSER